MNRSILSLILVLVAGPTFADLRPPERTLQPVTDPSMIVLDRGAKLEVLATRRAMPRIDASGHSIAHRVVTSHADSPIGPNVLGVVFNHAMQQQGFISGEISFKMKAGHTPSALSATLYPGLKKVTNPEVYVVNARTPAEFLAVLKRLHARHDVEWAEPTVTYGPSDTGQPDS